MCDSAPVSLFPDAVDAADDFREGSVRRVIVNAYERNDLARQRCIEHYAARCYICRFDFGTTYGQVVEGFIHVHHLRSLAEIGSEYVVDPVADLRPVCPNCHAVLHSRKPAYSIDEVIEFLRLSGVKTQD
jgi:predicted HNH restriction endonuclease